MVYEMNGNVRYSEVDAKGQMTWLALLSYFQDCSVFQSEHLNMGVRYLAEHHMAWVLSSWQVRVDEMPYLADEIHVQTWAYDFKGFYGYRNFALNNAEGKRLACANSIWVLVDTESGRPLRVPQDMGDTYGMDEPLELSCTERKIRVPENYEEKEPVRVQKYFIDTNHHMNNEKYVMIAQEFVPEHFQIEEIRVEYKKAAVLDDVLYPRVTIEDHEVVTVLAEENGKPYAIVKFLGRKEG
ncbi:acyl-ACP thioesterase [Roseburia sp. MUC/MUC-530-WT-4D]|uniref:Acyl-ACP thioesterase n=1 Tax=Roseburia porci TaxID=2605790 RepID=A0A6L5YSY5_9FIRM|nr:acyl-ACP thioesterase domain-containing protein [Roseburia porci]MCI5517579.1 thioesterase [Roseburia sp.]MDD6743890.1 thioesterase [Roseburia porci]MST75560.1 acyl-ACP thioesterase [Roseburia porci]